MGGEFVVFRWNGVIEVIGSGTLAVLVTGIVVALAAGFLLVGAGSRDRGR